MAESAQDKELKQTLSQIEKQFGKGAIMQLGEVASSDVQGISTGALSLDIALGGHGIPRGRITEIFGNEASGKTTIALHAVASAQKKGGVAAFIDAEHALDPGWAKRIGVNLESLLVSQPSCAEEALKKHMKKENTEIEKGEFKEATGAASAGQYSGPMFLAKDSKNWRGGAKPLYKGGKFVRVKKKCKNFPYCNQGDIKALKMWEDNNLTEAIKNVAKNKNIHENIVRAILLHEIEETIFKD